MRIAIVATALVVGGCVTTPDDLRDSPSARTLIGAAPTPVETTYRHLVTNLRKCFDLSSMIVLPNYFQDVKRGRIDILVGPGLAFAAIDLTSNGAGTLINVRYANPMGYSHTDQSMRQSIVAWANDEPGVCMFTPTIPKDDRSRQ